MGYTTTFSGQLSFAQELTASQLAHLQTFLGVSIPDDGSWIMPEDKQYAGYMQFELTPDFSGIKWDENEKFYGAEKCVNILLLNMQDKYPDFSFTGELQASGEEFDDRWFLRIIGGVAKRIDSPMVGNKVTCPHCDEDFIIEEGND